LTGLPTAAATPSAVSRSHAATVPLSVPPSVPPAVASELSSVAAELGEDAPGVVGSPPADEEPEEAAPPHAVTAAARRRSTGTRARRMRTARRLTAVPAGCQSPGVGPRSRADGSARVLPVAGQTQVRTTVSQRSLWPAVATAASMLVIATTI